MGWNTGYTIIESTVIGAYNLGKLDKSLLSVLLEPYRDTDVDSGGLTGLETNDGKTLEEVVITVWGGTLPAKPSGDYNDNPDVWDEYQDKVYDIFTSITKEFGV